MTCPQCGAATEALAKFCNQCGHRLVVACAHCDHVNPPGSRFCSECGTALSAASTPARTRTDPLAKVAAHLPAGLAARVLAERDRIEGERKIVTVLFCDLAAFTPASEVLGPEATYRLMDAVYEALIRAVGRFEGTVNELTGDGILALFGAPIAIEDAPARAIRAALEIHRTIDALDARLRADGLLPAKLPSLMMRIGIHSGPVVVGTLGNDLRIEFKAVGDTVNLASRMQTAAPRVGR